MNHITITYTDHLIKEGMKSLNLQDHKPSGIKHEAPKDEIERANYRHILLSRVRARVIQANRVKHG